MGYEKTCDHEGFELTCWECQDHRAQGIQHELYGYVGRERQLCRLLREVRPCLGAVLIEQARGLTDLRARIDATLEDVE